VSFSQNAEDVRLWRVFKANPPGFYVDVGAGDPVEHSVTKIFYDHGWTGINIDPVPSVIAKLEAERPRDLNLRLAVAPREELREFWISTPHSGLSSFYQPASEHNLPQGFSFVRETVECKPLKNILEEHASGRPIDFVKIDVEGAEGDVIESMDLGSARPTVIIVEAVAPLSFEPAHASWEPILTEAEYEFAVFDGINRFYVDRARSDLIPVLAYPISPLDRFVAIELEKLKTKAQRADEMEARLISASTEHRNERKETERLLQQANERISELGAEIDLLRRYETELATVYRSRTWRSGKVVAGLGAPFLELARSARIARRRAERPLRPSEGYAEATRRGEPWHFARRRALLARDSRADPLHKLLKGFGGPGVQLDRTRATTVAREIERLGWTDEESLLARRLSWDQRQAAIEADAIVRLVSGRANDPIAKPSSSEPVTVVDVRCLQDPLYSTRGVGLHSRAVLEAARAIATGHKLVFLASTDLRELDDETAGMADDVVTTTFAIRDARVDLFVELSPMTASAAPAVPFLGSQGCATVSVVYDFIPTHFPSAYLRSVTDALTNRIRLEALRNYDMLLPISGATAAECRRILSADARTIVTGVADPLGDVSPTLSYTRQPFFLVPAGGDPRKNAAAVLAVLARHRENECADTRAVFTGALSDAQTASLRKLAQRLGLPNEAFELRGPVTAAELAALYEGAELVFVASFAEGFSIPVAEAVMRGTPVVASDIAAHRELIGTGPWLAPADDIDGLARAASYVFRNRQLVIERQRNALGDMGQPSSVAERITAALETLLAERPETPRPRARGRSRPRLAVVSPLPPQRSGIADYTAFTFREVAKHADVEMYTGARPESAFPFPCHPLTTEPYLDRQFDSVINIVGNSHFHFPILDLMSSYGGACIAHDNRMIEAYRYYRGDPWTAKLLMSHGRPIRHDEIGEFLVDLDRLPAIGYDVIAAEASPLIVHGRALAERILVETGVEPLVIPFVPYNLPTGSITQPARAHARDNLGLRETILHLATFGYVDRRTKAIDLVLGAASWLHNWGIDMHLHLVGDAHADEQDALASLAGELGIAGHVTFHGHVPRATMDRFLVAVDVAVQLRTSSVLSLSGALADCIAFGVPTVTTDDLVQELEAPSYICGCRSPASSLMIAESIDALRDRRDDVDAIESERLGYLGRRSAQSYARALLEGLGLEAA
jgi:FkbM family methyltransferase